MRLVYIAADTTLLPMPVLQTHPFGKTVVSGEKGENTSFSHL